MKPDITTVLTGLARSIAEPKPGQVVVDIDPSSVPEAVRRIFDGLHCRFITMSATDARYSFELLYHFSDDSSGTIVTLRTAIVDKTSPRIASVAFLMKGANWIEREIHEMLGITFEGHPDPRHLLLSDDWPAGDYPLRREGKGRNG